MSNSKLRVKHWAFTTTKLMINYFNRQVKQYNFIISINSAFSSFSILEIHS